MLPSLPLATLPGRSVMIRDTDGFVATLYTDRTKTVEAANPVLIDANGNLDLYAVPGEYDATLVTDDVEGLPLRITVPIDPVDAATDPDITALEVSLAGKAADNAVVHLTGNETVSGTKTFVNGIRVDDSPGDAYDLRTRTAVTGLGLPALRPVNDNLRCALDIMPTGTPTNGSGQDRTWVDIIDVDCVDSQPPLMVTRVCMNDLCGYVGMVGYNSADIAARPLFQVRMPRDGAGTHSEVTEWFAPTGGIATENDYTLTVDPYVKLNKAGGSVVAGSGYRLKHDATLGFFYVPNIDGAPDGTPGAYGETTPLAYDKVNGRLLLWNGSIWTYLAEPAASFDPSTLSPSWWFKADGTLWQDSARTTPAAANADPVGAWDDASGNARHALQATAGKRPTLRTNVRRGKAVVRFDGVDDFLAIATVPTASARTFVAVIKKATAAQGISQTAIGLDGTSQLINTNTVVSPGWYYFATQAGGGAVGGGTPNEWDIIAITFTSTSSAVMRVNGGAGVTFDPNNSYSTATAFYIATNTGTGNYADIDVAEIIVVDSALSVTNLNNVCNNYLVPRWLANWVAAA